MAIHLTNWFLTFSIDSVFFQIESNIVRCPDPEYAEKMIAAIDAVRVRGDSVGGVVTCIVRNVPRVIPPVLCPPLSPPVPLTPLLAYLINKLTPVVYLEKKKNLSIQFAFLRDLVLQFLIN